MNRSYRFLLSLVAASKRPDFPALPPPIVRILEEVETFDILIREGKIASRAQLAWKMGFTRARITQLMGLLKLHPAIKAYLRGLPPGTPPRLVTEKKLRPLTLMAFDAQLQCASSILPASFTNLIEAHNQPGTP
jgi:hypothetical protein